MPDIETYQGPKGIPSSKHTKNYGKFTMCWSFPRKKHGISIAMLVCWRLLSKEQEYQYHSWPTPQANPQVFPPLIAVLRLTWQAPTNVEMSNPSKIPADETSSTFLVVTVWHKKLHTHGTNPNLTPGTLHLKHQRAPIEALDNVTMALVPWSNYVGWMGHGHPTVLGKTEWRSSRKIGTLPM